MAGDGGRGEAPARGRARPRPGATVAAEAAAVEGDGTLSAKHGKFREIGARRMERALAAIEVIGNLSHRGNYEFTEADVAKMTRRLHKAVDELEDRFKPTKGPRRTRFNF